MLGGNMDDVDPDAVLTEGVGNGSLIDGNDSAVWRTFCELIAGSAGRVAMVACGAA